MFKAYTSGAVQPPGKATKQQKQLGGDQRMIAIQTPDGVRLVPANALQVPPASVQVPVPNQAQAPPLPDAPYLPPGQGPEPVRKKKVKPVESSPVPKEGVVAPAADEIANKLHAGASVNVMKRASDAGLTLADQRVARRAIRELMVNLEKTKEAEWLGVVTAALAKNQAIYGYLKAVTVYAALAEARVDRELAGRVVKALRDSGMVPDGALPYDEADLDKMQAADALKIAKEAVAAVETTENVEKAEGAS
jgi:hypothetical protein